MNDDWFNRRSAKLKLNTSYCLPALRDLNDKQRQFNEIPNVKNNTKNKPGGPPPLELNFEFKQTCTKRQS